MRNGIPACFLLFLIGLSAYGTEPNNGEVGRFGDPACLVFEGNVTFSADEIRAAVVGDVRLLLASHPKAGLTSYLHLLEERLAAGYRATGFPDATVFATVDAGRERINVAISEGKRYECGEILFEGAGKLPVEALRAYLSAPTRPEKKLRREEVVIDGRKKTVWKNCYGRIIPDAHPVWKKGEPARFRGDYREYYHGWLVQACADVAGCYRPRFSLDWVRRDPEDIVDLKVCVEHPGHILTAGQVEFTGNERNSVDDILRYAGLDHNTLMTTKRWTAFDECIRCSGRFDRWERDSTTPSRYSEIPPGVRVTFQERPGVPPLENELTPEERIMIKFCQWLRWPGLWKTDAVLDFSYPEEGKPDREVRVIWGPNSGIAFLQREAGAPDEEEPDDHSAERRWGGGLVFLSDRTLIWGPGSEEYYGCGRVPFTLGWLLTFRSTDAAADGSAAPGIDFEIDSDFEYESLEEDATALPGAPATLGFEIDDLAGFALLKGANEVRLENGVLEVKANSRDMRIDAESGRLICVTMCDPTLETPVGTAREATLRFEADCLAKTVADIREHNRRSPNRHHADSPLGSFIQFVGSSFIPNEMDRGLLLHLVENPPLSELRHNVNVLFNRGPRMPAFAIPAEEEKALTNDDEYRLLAARFWTNGAARDEWPWQVGHLGFATCLRENPLAVSRWAFLNHPDLGPLAYAAAHNICSHSQNELARRCAEIGMRRLTEEAFLRDLEPFCNKNTPLGDLSAQIVRLFQSLTPEQLDRLDSFYDDANAPDVSTFIEYVRTHRKTDPAEFIRGAGRAAWHAGFGDVVRQWLLTNRADAPTLARMSVGPR